LLPPRRAAILSTAFPASCVHTLPASKAESAALSEAYTAQSADPCQPTAVKLSIWMQEQDKNIEVARYRITGDIC